MSDAAGMHSEDAGLSGSQNRPAEAGSRHYHLFLSHSHADAALVERLAVQLDTIGISCFLDAWDVTPGGSSVDQLEAALEASDAVAVIVASHGMGRWHAEEARQALRQAIDAGTRAFVVWTPGCDPDPPGLSTWLRERAHVDLRDKVSGGRVTRAGMTLLVAGALGMSPRAAKHWLDQRLGPEVPPDPDRSVAGRG